MVMTGCFRTFACWVRLGFREQVLCFGSVVCEPSVNSQRVATLLEVFLNGINLGLSANPKTGDNYPEGPFWRGFVCELLI